MPGKLMNINVGSAHCPDAQLIFAPHFTVHLAQMGGERAKLVT